jgi:hypothetical protein
MGASPRGAGALVALLWCVLKWSSQHEPGWRTLMSSIRRCRGGSVLGSGQEDDLGYARGGRARQAHRQASGTTELVASEVHRRCGRKASNPSGALRASAVLGGARGDFSRAGCWSVDADDRSGDGPIGFDDQSGGERQTEAGRSIGRCRPIAERTVGPCDPSGRSLPGAAGCER